MNRNEARARDDRVKDRVAEMQRQDALAEAFANALAPALGDQPQTETTPTPDADGDFLSTFDRYMKENHR